MISSINIRLWIVENNEVGLVPSLGTELADEPASYILRIQRDELERRLYTRRQFYINIRRDWTRGSKLMFVKKTTGEELFIGSGMIERIAELDELDDDERRHCIENNYYGKMLFESLARFHPAVPVQSVLGNQAFPLHGAIIADKDISKIESMVSVRIIS